MSINLIKNFIETFDEEPHTNNILNFPHLDDMIDYLNNKLVKTGIEHIILGKYYRSSGNLMKSRENIKKSIEMGNEIAYHMEKLSEIDSNPGKKYTDVERLKIKDEFDRIKDKEIKCEIIKSNLGYFYECVGLKKESLEMFLKIKDKNKVSDYHWNLYISYKNLEMKEMALYQLIESMKVDYLPQNNFKDIEECINNLSKLINNDYNLVKLLNVGPDRLTICRVSTTLSFIMNNYTIEIVVGYMS